MKRSNTYLHAKRELDILCKSAPVDDRPILEEFIPELLELVDKFGNSGQSGGSAPYVANVLSRAVKDLCLHQPIYPVMGIEEEWVDVSGYRKGEDRLPMYQNNRQGCLFKDGINGEPYYLDAIVWKGDRDKYDTFTGTVDGLSSRQFIKGFPFIPKNFYIDVLYTKVGTDDGEYHIKNPDQLKKVWKYYRKPEIII